MGKNHDAKSSTKIIVFQGGDYGNWVWNFMIVDGERKLTYSYITGKRGKSNSKELLETEELKKDTYYAYTEEYLKKNPLEIYDKFGGSVFLSLGKVLPYLRALCAGCLTVISAEEALPVEYDWIMTSEYDDENVLCYDCYEEESIEQDILRQEEQEEYNSFDEYDSIRDDL